MRAGVVIFLGSNCERDCYHAAKLSGMDAEYIFYDSGDLSGFDCVILPGGFSYGDYLRAGAVARFAPVMDAVKDFARRGGLVIGICNGFQILLEAGLLPGAMLRNRSLKFVCKDVFLRVENNNTPFTCLLRSGDVIRMPVAHAEGNYYTDSEGLASLDRDRRVVFRYCDKSGRVTDEANPNGSLSNIAGLVNSAGNVLGMMPHPERACEDILGSTDGKFIFDSIVAWWRHERKGSEARARASMV